jgi:hypothetical protein
MSTEYDAIEITRLLVFGTNTPSTDDYNKHIRAADEPPASIHYNMQGYMINGGGRYAFPSLFDAVEKFFDVSNDISDGIYNLTNMVDNGIFKYKTYSRP